MKKIFGKIKRSVQQIDAINRQKAIDDLGWEVQELKHVFALITMGTFVGVPAAPLPVTLELMKDAEEEFLILLSKINTAHSPLSEQFSKLDVI